MKLGKDVLGKKQKRQKKETKLPRNERFIKHYTLWIERLKKTGLRNPDNPFKMISPNDSRTKREIKRLKIELDGAKGKISLEEYHRRHERLDGKRKKPSVVTGRNVQDDVKITLAYLAKEYHTPEAVYRELQETDSPARKAGVKPWRLEEIKRVFQQQKKFLALKKRMDELYKRRKELIKQVYKQKYRVSSLKGVSKGEMISSILESEFDRKTLVEFSKLSKSDLEKLGKLGGKKQPKVFRYRSGTGGRISYVGTNMTKKEFVETVAERDNAPINWVRQRFSETGNLSDIEKSENKPGKVVCFSETSKKVEVINPKLRGYRLEDSKANIMTKLGRNLPFMKAFNIRMKRKLFGLHLVREKDNKVM